MEQEDNKIVVPQETIDLLEEKVLENNRKEIERIKEAVILQKRNQDQNVGGSDIDKDEIDS